MVFAPSASWNLRSITHLASCLSRSLPTNSFDESKLKAPSWVLGACTQREAVGGDSPPGMLSVDLRVSIEGLIVQNYFGLFLGGGVPWEEGRIRQKLKAPSWVTRGLHSEGGGGRGLTA